MPPWITRSALTVGTLAALFLTTAAATAAHTAAARWHVVYRAPSTAEHIYGVTAPSRADAWAFGTTSSRPGSAPVFLHWGGRRWRQVSIPGTRYFQPELIQSTSPDNVWIFGATLLSPAKGYRYHALVFDGSDWSDLTMPVNAGALTTLVVSRTDVWVVEGVSGCTAGSSCSSTLLHWNGAGWTTSTVGAGVQVMAAGGDHLWLVGVTGQTGGRWPTSVAALYRLTAAGWRRFSLPEHRIGPDPGLAASPGGGVWLLIPNAIKRRPWHLDHWNGSAWTRLALPSKVGRSGQLFVVSPALTYDGATGVWAGPYAHWTGRRWVNAFEFGRNLDNLAVIPGTPSIWSNGRQSLGGTERATIDVYGALP